MLKSFAKCSLGTAGFCDVNPTNNKTWGQEHGGFMHVYMKSCSQQLGVRDKKCPCTRGTTDCLIFEYFTKIFFRLGCRMRRPFHLARYEDIQSKYFTIHLKKINSQYNVKTS